MNNRILANQRITNNNTNNIINHINNRNNNTNNRNNTNFLNYRNNTNFLNYRNNINITDLDYLFFRQKYKYRENLLWSTCRASPIIYNIFNILNVLSEPSPSHIYFSLIYISTFYLNNLIKYLLKKIYLYSNYKYISFISISRPLNSTNEGYYLKMNDLPSYTIGMPCIHSQNSALVSIYLILKLLNNNNICIYSKYFGSFMFILSSLTISYGRIYIDNCNRLEHIIIGGILGLSLGLSIFYLENPIINLVYNKILK